MKDNLSNFRLALERWKGWVCGIDHVAASKHDARVGKPVIFYTFAFDVGRDVPYSDLADRLLKSELAEGAVAAGDDRVRLAPRFLQIIGDQRSAERLLEVDAFVNRRIKFNELRLVTRIFLLWVFVRVRVSGLLGFQKATDEERGESVIEIINRAIKKVDEGVQDLQVVLAAHNAVDRHLYQPSYLGGVPFYRLQLHAFKMAESEYPLVDHSGDQDSVEVELLIHHSGVALLNFVVSAADEISLDSLEPLTRSSETRFHEFEIAGSVVKAYTKYNGYSSKKFMGEWSNEMEEGQQWVTVNSEEPNSIVDIFEVHRDAILYFSGKPRSFGWVSCPTVFVDHLSCCQGRGEWMENHWNELLAVLGSTPPRDDVDLSAQESYLGQDYSHTRDESFYIPGGFTLSVNWLFDHQSTKNLIDWFKRTTVVENSLIQYWQVQTLNAELSVERYSNQAILNAVAQYSFGLEEVRSRPFIYGTANEIARAHYKKLGGQESDEHAKQKIEDLRDLINARTSTLIARRSARLGAAALLGALVLGLPAIKQGIDILSAIGTVRNWASATANSLSFTGDANIVSVILYVILILFVLPLMIVRGRERIRLPKKPQSRVVGILWIKNPVNFSLRSRRREDEESS